MLSIIRIICVENEEGIPFQSKVSFCCSGHYVKEGVKRSVQDVRIAMVLVTYPFPQTCCVDNLRIPARRIQRVGEYVRGRIGDYHG